MAKVKRPKDLTPKQRKVRRGRQYSELMAVELPETKVDLIVQGFWYIIYEENLLAPKILRYPFRAKLFASTYAKRHLSHTKYNVLSGEVLIGFGFHRAYNSMATAKAQGEGFQKYDYPEGLSYQRRKTIRTMYRRNYRRILKKLISHEAES